MTSKLVKLTPNNLFEKLAQSEAEKEILFTLIWFLIVIPIHIGGLVIVTIGTSYKY